MNIVFSFFLIKFNGILTRRFKVKIGKIQRKRSILKHQIPEFEEIPVRNVLLMYHLFHFELQGQILKFVSKKEIKYLLFYFKFFIIFLK